MKMNCKKIFTLLVMDLNFLLLWRRNSMKYYSLQNMKSSTTKYINIHTNLCTNKSSSNIPTEKFRK